MTTPPRRDPARGGGRLLRDVARDTRGSLALLVCVMVCRVVVALAVPALLSSAVNAVLEGDGGGLHGPALGWGAAVACAALCDAVMGPLGASGTSRATRRLRGRTVRHLLELQPRAPLTAGEAVTQITQAAPQAGALPAAAAQSAVALAGSLAGFAALWVIDWRTAAAFTLGVPLSVLIARRFVGRAAEAQSAYLGAQSDLATRLLGALAGARTIRASGTLTSETARVLVPLADVSAAGHAMWRLQKSTVWQFGLLLSLTEALALAVAGLGVAGGRLSPGQLLAVAGYVKLAIGALQQVDALLALAQARAGGDRIAATLAHPLPAAGPVTGATGPGGVLLKGITVRSAAGDPVLESADLELPAGRSMALVGRTGAGKSLLAGLLGRLSDPDAGQILLDGVDVRDLTLDTLRNAVTYAFERPALIGTTVHDAIAYGRPGASRPTVERAARAARADAFVRRLPAGYDTPLDHAPLSGGERQRLGLARALARPALVYVLDDATSGLDTVTEAEVSEAVTGALSGRTRLVVAHRVTTAARCDAVAWLDGGRIRAVGPHRELWRHADYRAVFAAHDDPAAEREVPCPSPV
ncbi:ABC transporter ATP-binding protein [Streptomyces griseoviridis]|uniref:ABC transporter ATP-binding protein n=1 Tax=Streptomyces griseoviridis TaxID=45398 RepID=A0A3Q9KU74_STRGD|nr:ABC transporter ATP-binding protein [Streptomyces griseoviridis]AZS89566.1 ABC transporter ATP-binding protein [Streptomyces griseoviridis]QCN83598.1 ABC transporter ATP-binding protein [Streptomyces griseoviridis]